MAENDVELINPYIGGDDHPDDADGGEDRGDNIETSADPVEDTGDNADADSSDNMPAADDADVSAAGDDSGDGDVPDTADSDEGDGADDVATTSPMIPKRRFDEVNERMKRAEQKLAEAEATQKANEPAQTSDFDFDAKEAEYMEAVLDGESDRALSIRREIRAAEEVVYANKIASVQESAVTQSKIQREFEAVVHDLESKVDRFNPNSEAFDEALVGEVLELQRGLVNQGYTPGDALNRAARYVVPDLDAPAAEPAAPAPAPRKTNVKQKVAASKQQPQPLSAGDNSSSGGDGVINVDALTEAEFDALPESKKRELRGDVV